LQAKEKKLEYNAEANTLNPEFGTPASEAPSLAQKMTDEAGMPAEAEGHSDGDHSGEESDHSGDHSHGDGGHGKK
jgi:hypothetical protein